MKGWPRRATPTVESNDLVRDLSMELRTTAQDCETRSVCYGCRAILRIRHTDSGRRGRSVAGSVSNLQSDNVNASIAVALSLCAHLN